MEVASETLRRLMEVGYVAVGSGQLEAAESIFAGIHACRPDSEMPRIGRALLRCTQGRAQDAVQDLQNLVDAHPEGDLARSFLGMALKLAGLQSRSETVLREVIARNRDPQAVALAQSLLSESPATTS